MAMLLRGVRHRFRRGLPSLQHGQGGLYRQRQPRTCPSSSV